MRRLCHRRRRRARRCVNRAPPSGAVLGPDPAALHGQQAARDPQAHAGARGAGPRRVAAIEPLEQARQVGGRDARPVVAHRHRQPGGRRRRRDLDRRTWRRVLRRVLEHVRERRGGEAGVEPHRDVGLGGRPRRRAAARRAPPGRGRRRRSRTGGRSAPRWPRRRRRAVPSRGCSGTAAAAARLRPGSVRSAPAGPARTVRRLAGWRRRRGWRSAASAGRVRATPAAPSSAARSGGSGPAALRSSRNCARSIPMATTPARASRVPGSTGRPAAASSPIGLVPTRSGTRRTVPIPGLHRPVPGVGAGVGVELEGGLRRRERRGQLPGVERHRRAGVVDVPFLVARQRDGDVVEVEPPGHRPGQRGERLAALGADQDVAAQIEQPGQLVAAADRLARPAPGPPPRGCWPRG